MGAYNRTCPTYATDEEQSFRLYEPLPIQGQGAVQRLAVLDASERRDILLRRAVVHAFVAAADKRYKWSEEAAWRRLNFWREGASPFNRDPWGYSRYLGMRSAHLDLVTFAEEYFVRPESVLAESTSPGADARAASLDRDLAMQCQEFSRLRFLFSRVRVVAPAWQAPEDPNQTETGCAAFDDWARVDAIEGIDVLLAAATADRPQSLWGHLLIHVRQRDRADGFEPVYQFGAVVSSKIDPVEYVTRGLMGGYQAVLDPYDYREIDRAVLRTEQRSLKRYRLQLTDTQTLRVMQRIWEMERRVRLPYWFFDENCAAFLADLLQSALSDLDIAPRSDFIVAPTDVLDHLASVPNPPHGPLLRKLAEESLSNREQARWARRRRRDALTEVGSDADIRGRLMADLEASDPAIRMRGHVALTELLSAAVQSAKGDDQARLIAIGARVLSHSVDVERYYLESKITQANEVWAQVRQGVEPVASAELLARRRLLYVHENADRRRTQRLARDAAELREFQSAHRRPLRRSEKRIVEEQTAAREAFDVAVNVRRDFHRTYEIDADNVRAQLQDELLSNRAHVDAQSIGRSGKERVRVGMFAGSGADDVLAGLSLGFAFLDERLGSQRTRGFRPDIETKVFDLRLDIPLATTESHRPVMQLVLLRYLSIEQLLRPARRSWLDIFGYGFDINVASDPTVGVDLALQGSGGLLLPVAKSAELVSHLVVGVFPTIHHLVGSGDERSLGGVWAFARVQAHLFGNFANVMRFELSASPLLDLTQFDADVGLAATSEVELYLGELAHRPILVVPHGGVERTAARLAGEAAEIRWTGGVRLESAL